MVRARTWSIHEKGTTVHGSGDRRSPRRGRPPVAALAAAALLAAAPAALAADPPRYDLRVGRVCDQTLCYVVWGQVDSDGDGYNDADEKVAGTDPLDPSSHPGPKDILDVAIDRQLPTFEAGMGAFVALPNLAGEIAGHRFGTDPLAALPIPQRAGALERLGISPALLKEKGISIDNGFTLGLDAPSSGGNRPPIRVGGINMALISAGDGPMNVVSDAGFRSHGDLVVYTPGSPTGPGKPHGDVVSHERSWFSDTEKVTYQDGYSKTHEQTGPGSYQTTTFDAKGNEVAKETTRQWDDPDGTHHEHTVTTEKDATGDITSITEKETVTHPGGGWASVTHTSTFHKDQNGNATGITNTTTEVSVTASGASTTTQTTEECDAGGENCTSQTVIEDDDGEYVNPDADQFVITDELADQVIRGLGAVVTPMHRGHDPITDGQGPQDPGSITPIALIDDQTGTPTLVLNPPRVTKAQPEVHPGLPNPRDAVGSAPRRCTIGC